MHLRIALTLLLAFVFLCGYAQQRVVEGIVTDGAGSPIAGARVAGAASGLPAVSDDLGRYRLSLDAKDRRVEVSAPGYVGLEAFLGSVSRVDFVLEDGVGLRETVRLGGLRPGRTAEASPLPVEVVYRADRQTTEPYATLGQVLTFATSTLRALPQTSGTPADFVDPFTLVGSGPGQFVLLVNGHRRHRSAQLPTATVVGRGTPGFDLATIPLAAVERVELLRGPAAAIYGTDAVAGVVNVVLARDAGFSAAADAGTYLTDAVPIIGDPEDGRFGQLALGYGFRFGKRGGFANVTAVAARREPTNRAVAYEGPIYSGFNDPGSGERPDADITANELGRRGFTREDFRDGAGQAAEDRASAVLHAEFPLGDDWTAYAFGDYSLRETSATGAYALPNEARTNTLVFSDGFAPEINGTLDDQSGVLGVRGRWRGWEFDASGGFGRSSVERSVDNTANASLGVDSPRDFDAGGAEYWRGIARAEARRYAPNALAGLHFAIGAGHRLERYALYDGDPGSYGRGAITADALGRPTPRGAQGLLGVGDLDAGERYRSNFHGYADLEVDIVPRVTVAATARYELFDDLGGGAMASFRTRVAITDVLTMRGNVSSGLRAPTLQEGRYSAIFTTDDGLRAGTFPANSTAAAALALDPLGLETHVGFSGGFNAVWSRLKMEFSADAFLVDTEDAVTLTDTFGAEGARPDIDRRLGEVGVDRARFFVNALDTRTYGVTGRFRHVGRLPGDGALRLALSATYALTDVLEVDVSSVLTDQESLYLPRADRKLLEASAPQWRGVATAYVEYKPITLMLRGSYFGQVEAPVEQGPAAQVYDAVPLVEASLACSLNEVISLTVGASNVLDAYPDRNGAILSDGGRAPFSRTAQQFGSNGRYLFARLSYRLP